MILTAASTDRAQLIFTAVQIIGVTVGAERSGTIQTIGKFTDLVTAVAGVHACSPSCLLAHLLIFFLLRSRAFL